MRGYRRRGNVEDAIILSLLNTIGDVVNGE